nr:unnamed protein product [Callosobruchus analis]
MLAQQSNGSV